MGDDDLADGSNEQLAPAQAVPEALRVSLESAAEAAAVRETRVNSKLGAKFGDDSAIAAHQRTVEMNQAKWRVAARRVVQMGLAMQRVVAREAAEREVDISVRIGVHTGKVVGGIIGTVRFHFDMWGNGVAGAVRMEELGSKGAVHLSNTTAQLVAGTFELASAHDYDHHFQRSLGISSSYYAHEPPPAPAAAPASGGAPISAPASAKASRTSRTSRTSERAPLRRPNGVAGAPAKGATAGGGGGGGGGVKDPSAAAVGGGDEHSHLSHLGSDAVAHGMLGRFMRDTLEDTHHDAAYDSDDGGGSHSRGGHEADHAAPSFRSAARKLQSKASELAIKVRARSGRGWHPPRRQARLALLCG